MVLSTRAEFYAMKDTSIVELVVLKSGGLLKFGCLLHPEKFPLPRAWTTHIVYILSNPHSDDQMNGSVK